jgi:hypothetical protein
VHKIRLGASDWSNIETSLSENELRNYHIVMSHQQSTRCIITLLIIYHSRNCVTIQQNITTLQQIIITYSQTVITLPEDSDLSDNWSIGVNTLLTLCISFNVLENRYNDSRNRYNDSLEYVDLSENSQSITNVL